MSTSCETFSIPFTGTADAVVQKIKEQVAAQGGTCTGDASAGSFDVPTPVGRIKGTYAIDTSQQIDVTITNKPGLFPSCNQIEGYIKDHI